MKIAVYFLVLFVMPISEELSPFRPVAKFFCIKAVIFFSFWQDVLISFLVWFDVIKAQPGWSSDSLSIFIQDALICIEMFLLVLYFTYAFSYEEFLDPDYQRKGISPLLTSVAHIVSPKDVLNDTVDVFGRSLAGEEPSEKRRGTQSSLKSSGGRQYGTTAEDFTSEADL